MSKRLFDIQPKVRAIVLSVAPGITDWAPILYPEESAIRGHAAGPERAHLARERSFWTSLRSIFSTLPAIVH